MTGTPVANRPYDIWAQIFFLDQGKSLGTDFRAFKKETDLSNKLSYDENMQEYIIEGTELLARCLCHEIDHLDGVMYVDKATEMMQIDKEDDEA